MYFSFKNKNLPFLNLFNANNNLKASLMAGDNNEKVIFSYQDSSFNTKLQFQNPKNISANADGYVLCPQCQTKFKASTAGIKINNTSGTNLQ